MPLPAPWSQISRSERYFCAALYEQIRINPVAFLAILQNCALVPPQFGQNWHPRKPFGGGKLKLAQAWDAGLEVCLFRDLLHFNKAPPCKHFGYSAHTVFDLAFASDDQYVVIEAKGFESFSTKQSLRIPVLRKQIAQLLGINIGNVFFFGLISSTYYSRIVGNNHQGSMANFDGVLSWRDLYAAYPCNPLLRAEAVYV